MVVGEIIDDGAIIVNGVPIVVMDKFISWQPWQIVLVTCVSHPAVSNGAFRFGRCARGTLLY